MTMRAAPLVCCFDIGGTLLETGPSFAQAVYELVGRPLGAEESDTFLNLARGEAGDDLRRLATQFQVNVDDLLALHERHRERRATLYADVLPALRGLGEYRCVALSNAARWLVGEGLGGAEAHLSAVFYSHEMGASKPHVDAFRHVERALGVAANRIVMIGDSLTHDYQAARAAGWDAILVDREGRHAGDATLDRITDLSGLLDRLKQRTQGPAPEIEVVGSAEMVGETMLVDVPAEILGEEYTARPVRVRTARGKSSARVVRGRGGRVSLLVSPSQRTALGLTGEERTVSVLLTVIAERLLLTPPKDLELALVEAGLSWESIPERDRHVTVGLVKEAETPELRRGRIQRIVAALLEAQ